MRAASSLPRARRGRSGAGSESGHVWVWRERERAACLDAGERGGRRKLSGQRGQLSACEITKGHSAGRRGRGVGVSVERRRGWLENVGRDRGGGAGGWRSGAVWTGEKDRGSMCVGWAPALRQGEKRALGRRVTRSKEIRRRRGGLAAACPLASPLHRQRREGHDEPRWSPPRRRSTRPSR